MCPTTASKERVSTEGREAALIHCAEERRHERIYLPKAQRGVSTLNTLVHYSCQFDRPTVTRRKKNKHNQSQAKKSQILQAKQLEKDLAWLIDSNYPQRRSNYLAGYLHDPQAYLASIERTEEEIEAGKILGYIATAVLVVVSGGSWLLAAIGLAASVLYDVLSPQKEQSQQQRVEDPKFSQTYTGSASSGLARYGDVIPAIFTSRFQDITGGVYVEGKLISKREVIRDGKQRIYIRAVVSHGKIGSIDLAKTLINDQPRANFNPTSISLRWHDGTQTTAPVAFENYSQSNRPSVNNVIGVNLASQNVAANVNSTNTLSVPWVDEGSYSGSNTFLWVNTVTGEEIIFKLLSKQLITAVAANSALIIADANFIVEQANIFKIDSNNNAILITQNVPASEFNDNNFTVTIAEEGSYVIGENYRWVGVNSGIQLNFTVTSKVLSPTPTGERALLNTDKIFPLAQANIFRYNEAYYRSTKRVSQLDLNFDASVWARNSSGVLIDFACIYQISIKPYRANIYQPICNIIIASKLPDRKLRSLSIASLVLDTYDIKITPQPYLTTAESSIASFVLTDSGAIGNKDIAIGNNYGNARLTLQGYLTDPRTWVSQSNTSSSYAPQNSAQSGATLVILSVNEIEYANATGRPRDLSLYGLATVESIVTVDSQLNNSIDMKFFVNEGIIVNSPIATGTALAGSSGGTLIYPSLPIAANLFVRNLDNRLSSLVRSVTATSLLSDAALNWSEGDRFLIYSERSTCWVPEIRDYLAWYKEFGLSEDFIYDYDIDHQSSIDATNWLKNNEHGVTFAWHGVLGSTEEIGIINDRLSREVMLFPCDQNGLAGYLPQKTPISSNGRIYNANNAANFRLEYSARDSAEPNQVDITYKELEQTYLSEPNLKFAPMSLSVKTWRAARRLEPTRIKAIDLSNCTNRLQALKYAQITLNLLRHAGKVACTFNATTIDSLYLPVGDLARIQTVETSYNGEQSGIVVAVNGARFRIDREPTLVEGISVLAANGCADRVVDYLTAGVSIGDLVLNLESGIFSPVIAVFADRVECLPIVPADTQYQILNLTTQDSVVCVSKTSPTTLHQYTSEYIDGHVWHTILTAGIIPEVTEVALFGKNLVNERLFQCLGVTPTIIPTKDGTGEFRSSIVASNWTSKFYDTSDLTWTTRDGDFNLPT